MTFEHCVKASSDKAMIYGSEFSHGKAKAHLKPLNHMHLSKIHGLVFFKYTVIQDVTSTGGLKDIPLFA
jgi:hypothetical protein